MDDRDRATQPQIKLIESLYANLRIRNTSLYGGAPPAQLSKQHASEVIDVLTLRKLSGQLGRPVTADLTNPAQVREQLARVEQLTDGHHTRHAAAAASRTQHSRTADEISDGPQRQLNEAAAPWMLPHRRRREQPQPGATLTAEQLAARAAELDRVKEPRLDAAGRYTDVTGYGSSASYHGHNGRTPSDSPQLTDAQERTIIELQDAGHDNTVSSTVVEASDYLNQTLAPREPLPPTERQIAYLHKLEQQAGKTAEQLSHPGTRQGASRRIHRLLDAESPRRDPSAAAEIAETIACTHAASPHTVREVTAGADAGTSDTPAMAPATTTHGRHSVTHEEARVRSANDGR